MSIRILTKLLPFSFAFFIAWSSANFYSAEQKAVIKNTSACMMITSHLPRNHSAHPCYNGSQPNQSWLSWLSGNSRSAHFQFLDLVELLQSMADSFNHSGK